MIPITITIWTLLSMLAGMFPAWGVGAEYGPSMPSTIQGARPCGAYHYATKKIWVDSSVSCINSRGNDMPEAAVLAHELGHAVEGECMTGADRSYYQSTFLGVPVWQNWYVSGASEKFADAFGDAVTRYQGYNTGPYTRAARDAALYYWAVCVNKPAVNDVNAGYQVFLDRDADKGGQAYWVALEMTGEVQARGSLIHISQSREAQTNRVSRMNDWAFVDHAFRNTLNRRPNWSNGEWGHWVRHLRATNRYSVVYFLSNWMPGGSSNP